MNIKTILKARNSEKTLFFLFAIANLIPVFLVKYVGSLDGPQHLYVSNIVGQLWKNESFYDQFFQFNTFIIGNSLGSYLLALFNLFFADWIAEKILIIFYLIGIAYAFRYLVTAIKGKSTFLSFFIFPFSYTSLFMLGYYNFSIAIAIMMWAFGYWIRIQTKLTPAKLLFFSIILVILYYSHIFVFVFFLMALGLYYIFNSVIYIHQNKGKKGVFKGLFVRALWILLAAMPGILLGLLYMKSISGKSMLQRLPYTELVDSIHKIKILIGYVPAEEAKFTVLIFFLISILVIYQWLSRIIKNRKSVKTNSPDKRIQFVFRNDDFWLLLALFFLVLYFIIPDRLSAGNISARISIVMSMFFLTWISVQEYPRYIPVISLVLLSILAVNIQKIHIKYLKKLDLTITEIGEVSKQIQDKSVYVTANYSPNWLHFHFQSYVGSEKPIIDINSAGCSDQFAVNWNSKQLPFAFIGSSNATLFSYVYVNNPRSPSTVIAEYAVIIGYREFSELDPADPFKRLILHNYNLIFKSSKGHVALFRLSMMNSYLKIEKKLSKDPQFMQHILEKAKEYAIPEKEVLKREALWMLSQQAQ